MSKTKNQVIDQQNDKQQAIQYLTDLVAEVSNYYLKGRIKPEPLRISESRLTPGQIGIDLYNFGTKPVCDGLNFVPIYFDDGTDEQGFVFAMHYNADDPTPLTFLVDFTNLPEVQVGPDSLPTDTLQNIARWLEQAAQDKQQSDAAAVQQAKDIITLWSDWCMDYDDENLWLDYMVRHPKGHCNRQHLQEKWHHCYEKYGNKAAMHMFWRELDNDNRAILTEYITTEWHKD